MKKLYFFFQRQKKIQLRDRLHEWHVNFYREKKHTKNTQKFGRKKKHYPLSKKKIKKNPPDPELMAHELFLGKKKRKKNIKKFGGR